MKKHGETTHTTQSCEYATYHSMMGRCYRTTDHSYHNYGARGIFVCEAWRGNFRQFLSDMGRRPTPGHSLERLDNDGPYSPDNCEWVPRSVQNRNHRGNRRITIGDNTQILEDWCALLGVPRRTFYNRVGLGMTDEEALTYGEA